MKNAGSHMGQTQKKIFRKKLIIMSCFKNIALFLKRLSLSLKKLLLLRYNSFKKIMCDKSLERCDLTNE